MKDGQMTTVLVHNLLTKNEQKKNIEEQRSPVKAMKYVEYIPNNYQAEIQQKIRSRSFYQYKNEYGQKLRLNTKKNFHKSIESDNSLKEPKIIDVQFDLFKRSKSKKQCNKEILSNQYYSLMVDSMQKYISKVEKGKKKKKQRCEKIKNFGVDIKSITYNNNMTQKKQMPFIKHFIKPSLDKQRENKKITTTSNQQRKNMNQNNEFVLAEEMINSGFSEKNKIFSQTISHNAQRPKFFHKKISLIKYEKKDEEKGVNAKLNKMLNFFTILLYSYGVYLERTKEYQLHEDQLTKTKKKDKYFYYIGRGNNKNLLISILKKRWWWAEAEDMSSADFVWTQLKVGTILCKQTSMNYSELEQARSEKYKRNPFEKIIATNNYAKIFHPQHSPLFLNKISEKQEKNLLRGMKPPNILHNHYEANYMLGNKKALFHNMVQFCNYTKVNPFQIIPLTFHVQKINSKSFKAFQNTAKSNKNLMWIVKPGENSNRGNGIFVSDSFDKIKKSILKDSKHTHIIQKYMKNNFLFQRRKFDIRTYVLLVSIGGIKKFYWYSEGYLRTASQIYDLTDLDDPFIHLTNDAIQVNGDNYSKYQKGNKVTYHEFQRYLDINYADEKYSVSNLVAKMKNIAKQVVKATYFKIDPCRKETGLQLFGLDFLIDNKFKPWLLQVNTNPCLELSSPVLERLIPRMIENMFRIAIDPIFQPAKGQFPRNLACYVPENIADNNRFQLIFDTLFDRDYSWEQFSTNHSKNQTYEDQDEQFDDDGDIIKIDY